MEEKRLTGGKCDNMGRDDEDLNGSSDCGDDKVKRKNSQGVQKSKSTQLVEWLDVEKEEAGEIQDNTQDFEPRNEWFYCWYTEEVQEAKCVDRNKEFLFGTCLVWV